jgi:CBS domain-containing protein
MNTARDITHVGADRIGERDTLESAARHMRELGVDALPICGGDGRLHGVIAERDIVIYCVGLGFEPGSLRRPDVPR